MNKELSPVIVGRFKKKKKKDSYSLKFMLPSLTWKAVTVELNSTELKWQIKGKALIMLLYFFVHLVCKFKTDHILQAYFANAEPPLLTLLKCLSVSKPMLGVARLLSLRSRILVPMETGLPI